MTHNLTITITADEARTLKYLLIKEERLLENQNQQFKKSAVADLITEEAAELTALRQKIHN